MTEIGAFEAKTHFSRLLDRARLGEEFIITHRGMAVARLMPIADAPNESRTRQVLARLRARARQHPEDQVSLEEIIAWRDEGRR
jgi:prevent-host-death family protein